MNLEAGIDKLQLSSGTREQQPNRLDTPLAQVEAKLL